MIGRIVGTVTAVLIYLAVNAIYSPIGMLASSKLANQQFEDSDTAFVTSLWGMQFLGGIHTVFSVVLLLVVALIWFKPIRNAYRSTTTMAIALIVATGITISTSANKAHAFASNGDDVAEWYPVEPDETAFLIPNFGASLSSQAQYQPAYLNGADVKVPGKFIKVPHGKLSGSGGATGFSGWLGRDYWVNTSTLVIVKRSQYSRVWVQKGRGTNREVDESFNCQTADGLNILRIGVTTIALIEDKNAALYLSNFGQEKLDPKLDRTKIENIFISVRTARTLNNVIDDVGYAKVHELVCGYIAKEANPKIASSHMNTIIESVRNDYVKYMAELGVTVKALGWADNWTFDPDVQFSMNQSFNATMVAASLDVLERNARINLQEGMAVGFREKMPGMLFLGSPELLGVAASGAAARTAGGVAAPTK